MQLNSREMSLCQITTKKEMINIYLHAFSSPYRTAAPTHGNR